MQLVQWGKVLVVGLSILTLAACSKKPNAGDAGVGDAGPEGVHTYGVQSGTGYGDANGSGVRRNQYGEVINSLRAPSNQTYYFTLDSTQVRAEDLKAISVQANYLVAHPGVKIRLEGNTDERGSREYNIGLGWRRDQAVAQLFEQQGVSSKQIDMVSYGKERPVSLGHDESAWRVNRRVDLRYEAGQ